MKINACIYDAQQNLAGCITDTVINRFYAQFYEIVKYEFPDDFMMINVLKALENLEASLIQSEAKNTADFLNCMKSIVRNKESFPIDFVQKVSRSYHNLIRYCTSSQVYDEVLNETIALFKNVGLEYRGKGIQGVAQDEHAFDYQGITAGIKMDTKNDLYAFWSKEPVCNAVVYASDRKYFITSNREFIALSVKSCIEDYKSEQENHEQEENIQILSDELINVALQICQRKALNEL